MKSPSHIVEDDALVHFGRGPRACTTPASDETKARTETKAAVEIAYIGKVDLASNDCCSNRGEQPFILYLREAWFGVVRTDAS